MRYCSRAFITVASFAFTLGAASSASADRIALTRDRSVASAPVRITNATMFYSGAAHNDEECVSFVNRTTQTATKIRFVFSHIDVDGNVQQSDPFDRSGSFAPGVVIHGVETFRDATTFAGINRFGNCRSFSPPKHGAKVVISIESVIFADGSSWPTEPTASPVSAQANQDAASSPTSSAVSAEH